MPKLVNLTETVRITARKSFSGVEALLYREDSGATAGKFVPRRKVSNNTYLERRPEGVALVLHQTDILTWKLDNTVTLNTGGWYSMTTKARMNDWLPSRGGLQRPTKRWAQVFSDRGYWQVEFARPTEGEQVFTVGLTEFVKVPFHDGMVVDLSTLTEWSSTYSDEGDRVWNAGVDKLIASWLRKFPGDFTDYLSGPTGAMFADPERMKPHLLAMLSSKPAVYPSWMRNAIQSRQTGDSNFIFRRGLQKRDISAYLRGMLYRGNHTRRFQRPLITEPF